MAGAGRGASAFRREELTKREPDRGEDSESQYEKGRGYQGSLFSNSAYEEDDIQADKEYDRVDQYMDERRNTAREERIKMEMERSRKAKPPVSSIFASCKKELARIRKEEWENLPESVPHSGKRKKYSRVMPVPDNILESALNDVKYGTSVI